MNRSLLRFKCIASLLVLSSTAQFALAENVSVGELAEMSIEQLSQVKITSSAKREQSLNEANAAVFVISQQDIRRSTATTIPELLRMVPGLSVAQVNAHTWSITARGFSGSFANKLLVLVDGRSVYSPLFSGTYWEAQDYPLEDIERIEVIRGPGGTLWGSNAVNGVINIITKRAEDTQGILVSAGGGNEAQGVGDVRYGFTAADWAARVYARGRIVDDAARESGGAAADGYESGQGGFKVERDFSSETALTVQGDIYAINESERLQNPLVVSPFSESLGRQSRAKGGNILARLSAPGIWKDDKSSIQLYFDRTTRDELQARTEVTTFDLDTQYDLHYFQDHTLVFGAGVRHIGDWIGARKGVEFDPASRDSVLVNTFIQDEYSLIPESLILTTGVKMEHNEYTGAEWQPTVRLAWHPAPGYAVWSAVSRAVRIPSRINNDLNLDVTAIPPNEQIPLPTLVELTSNRNLQSESVVTYEIGARAPLAKTISLDTALFFADYTDLQTYDVGTAEVAVRDGVPVAVQPLIEGNKGRASVYGIENVIEWSPQNDARIQMWHAFQIVEAQLSEGSTDMFLETEENNYPSHQIGLRGQFDLPWNLEFNPFVRFVDSMSSVDAPSYWEADMQLAWKAQQNLRLALNLTNTFHDNHNEYRTEIPSRTVTKLERALFLGIVYRY